MSKKSGDRWGRSAAGRPVLAEPITVDLTPTDGGFLMLACTLVRSVLRDVEPSRKEAVIGQLAAVLDIAIHLGRKARNREEATALIDRIVGITKEGEK